MRTLFSCHSFKSHNGWHIAGNYFGLFSSHLIFELSFLRYVKCAKVIISYFRFRHSFGHWRCSGSCRARNIVALRPGWREGKKVNHHKSNVPTSILDTVTHPVLWSNVCFHYVMWSLWSYLEYVWLPEMWISSALVYTLYEDIDLKKL